jgi:hypothetical protein
VDGGAGAKARAAGAPRQYRHSLLSTMRLTFDCVIHGVHLAFESVLHGGHFHTRSCNGIAHTRQHAHPASIVSHLQCRHSTRTLSKVLPLLLPIPLPPRLTQARATPF